MREIVLWLLFVVGWIVTPMSSCSRMWQWNIVMPRSLSPSG
jgi:hypothetical protein